MRFRTLICLLIVSLAGTACQRDPDVILDPPELSITIDFPLVPEATKETVKEVPASVAENTIHDLKIWVFNANTHILEAGYSTSTNFPEGGGVRKYALPVSWAFSHSKPAVDVFVLVNSASIGLSNLSTTRPTTDEDNFRLYNTVYTASFTGDAYFCAHTGDAVRAVPENGLPMSGISTGLKLSGQEPSFTLATVSLKRAVSKLRFVFSQMYTEGEADEYAIQKVVLNSKQIAKKEFVFSESNFNFDTAEGYVDAELETAWPQNTQLASCLSPGDYSYAGQDGATYETLINAGVKAGDLTDLGVIYLRESDLAISGTVYYTVKKYGQTVAEERTADFSMAAPGDFARNHSWTLYGYFVNKRALQLGIVAMPWDKNEYTIKFDTSTLQVTQPFTVDPAPNVKRIGETDHYNVFLDSNKPVKGYIYVTTPQGGYLEVIPVGNAADIAAFSVTPSEALIDPTSHGGRIDITIARNWEYTGDAAGKTITLSFEAYTPDRERKISGESECINQIYHFYL